jgi:hypothetical protein
VATAAVIPTLVDYFWVMANRMGIVSNPTDLLATDAEDKNFVAGEKAQIEDRVCVARERGLSALAVHHVAWEDAVEPL